MEESSSYIYNDLLPENIYGHTKKVELFRAGLDGLRNTKGKGLRILDVGCGSGYAVTRFLANSTDQVIGIDLHANSIEFAKQHYAGSGIEFYLMKAEDISDSWEKFDAIVLADVLEHVDNPKEILLQARKLLEPAGRIFVSVPNGRGPFEIESYIRGVPLAGWLVLITIKVIARLIRVFLRDAANRQDTEDVPYNAGSPHIHFFSRKQIEKLAANTDLDIIGWRNLTLFCGPYSGELLVVFKGIYRWNCKIADAAPRWAVSAWFIELTAKKVAS